MLNILPGTSWLSQAVTMSQPRSTKGLSLQGKILQHLMKRQITSLPSKLSCVQRSILVLQWLSQTTQMCLSCSSFITWMNGLLVNIKFTVQAHQSITPGLPAAHALSGCDTVPTCFGIDKGTVLKNLIATPKSLLLFGCLDAPLSDIVDQATKFIGACYGNRVGKDTMSDIRYKILTTKFGSTATSAPKIQALPPTTEAFVENVKRSHLQTGTW